MTGLRKYFTGTACKHLSAVDAPGTSHQHEIGSNRFKSILGDPGRTEKFNLETTYLYFPDDEAESVIRADGQSSYYNSRKNPARSPECRLYYQGNDVTKRMSAGDFCLLAIRPDRQLFIIVTPAETAIERRLRYLFDQPELTDSSFSVSEVHDSEIGLVERTILEELGIEVEDRADDYLGMILDKFGETFPSTSIFSAFARQTLSDANCLESTEDQLLEMWMEREERLFRTLERQIVEKRLATGFANVEEFLSFSLSVQNRRKSRAGHALENHLQAIFKLHGIAFTRNGVTENGATPDFLFPDIKQYHDPAFPAQQLKMLGAKTTCKDRWRQVLTEARRIEDKHLLTMESAISSKQTDEMRAHGLQLVVTDSVRRTYTPAQQSWLMNLQGFMALVR